VRILLTNDDGIHAPGLTALERAAKQLGEVIVVAPAEHQSGISHQVTAGQVISVWEDAPSRFAVGGTPADCVRLGLTQLARDVDWVFAGINDGANLGVDILMSGTVAAAREAALLGTPAISWSQYVMRPDPVDWEAAIEMLQMSWDRVEQLSLPKRAFWNVNFPHAPDVRRLAGPQLCSPEPQPLPVEYRPQDDGYFYCGRYAERPRSPGRDVDICFGGGIALSKLTADA